MPQSEIFRLFLAYAIGALSLGIIIGLAYIVTTRKDIKRDRLIKKYDSGIDLRDMDCR